MTNLDNTNLILLDGFEEGGKGEFRYQHEEQASDQVIKCCTDAEDMEER